GGITLDGQNITFSNVSAVNDLVSATGFTTNGTSGSDGIGVVDGPIVNSTQTTAVTNAGVAPPVNFANKTSVTINSGAGTDTITFNNPNPAAGLINLTVTGIGSDAVTLSGPVSVPGTLSLTATNGVTEQPGGAINAGSLVLNGSGTFSL